MLRTILTTGRMSIKKKSLLSIVLLIGLSACGSDENNNIEQTHEVTPPPSVAYQR